MNKLLTSTINTVLPVQDIPSYFDVLNLADKIINNLEIMQEAFFIVDNDWNIVYINSELEQFTKRSAKDLIGKSLWKISPSIIGTSFESNYRKSLSQQIPITFQEFYSPWNKYLEARVFPCDKGLSVYLRDVSSEYQSQSQLLLLEKCVENLNDLVVITKIDLNKKESYPTILFVNEAFVKVSGYSKEEVLRKNLSLLNGPVSQFQEISKARHAINNLLPLRTEMIISNKVGRAFDVELDIVPVVEKNAQCGYCVIVARDITERKKHEKLLKEHEESLHFILNSGQVAYWDNDFINGINYRSDLYFNLFGYESEVYPWNMEEYYAHIHPEDKARVMYEYNRTLAGGEDYSSEFRCIWPNGEVHWLWSRGRVFFDEHKNPIRASGIMTDISQRKNNEQQIEQLAFYDSLTNLPNRRFFTDKLQNALSYRNNSYNAVLFIDLDNFKTLNDTLGHDKGDKLLQEVATRLVSCLRKSDTVARLGGDEFVVLLNYLNSSYEIAYNEVQMIGEKILEVLNTPFNFDDYEHLSTGSVGATLFGQGNYSIDDLLKQADVAMYQAKANGRNSMVFFKPEMQEAISVRVSMENDLRNAIGTNQFQLYYQPQISSDNKVYGAEALIRWIHPEKGLISPVCFIPLAEETGLILELGQWVIEEACHQLVKWSKSPATKDFTLAVNISILSFQQPSFVHHIINLIHQTGVDPTKIKLELTESLLVNNMEQSIDKMNELTKYGVNFSLDDFGTGYSSLSYLKRMPLQQLKIDKSFVRDMLKSDNDAIISKTIINLAKSLELNVIAEGVETLEQQKFLAENDCHLYQGFYYSKPLPIEEFNSYVHSLENKLRE